MKVILIFIHLILLKSAYQAKDSVNVRIFNDSKYFVKHYNITKNGNEFSYLNVPPHSYSSYKNLPYIYQSNQYECTFLVKKFLSNTYSITYKAFPIDHIGERKTEKGSATLKLNIKSDHKKFDIETHLIQ